MREYSEKKRMRRGARANRVKYSEKIDGGDLSIVGGDLSIVGGEISIQRDGGDLNKVGGDLSIFGGEINITHYLIILH